MDTVPKHQVEALLFASGKTMTEDQLAAITRLDKQAVRRALKALQDEYAKRDGPIIIWNDNTGWKMTVRDAYVPVIKNIVADTDLSRACMETLAVIAYKYPNAMQAEVVDIRGSGAYEHIAELERLGFVVREASGRSYKLKLTEKFFQYFDVAGGDIREVFKGVKPPKKADAQQTLAIVPVPEQPPQGPLGNMEVVEVTPEPELPPEVLEARKAAEQPEEDAPRTKPITVEESEAHRKFLDDLDQRIAQLSARNNERDQDETYRKRMADGPPETGAQDAAPESASPEPSSPPPEQPAQDAPKKPRRRKA